MDHSRHSRQSDDQLATFMCPMMFLHVSAYSCVLHESSAHSCLSCCQPFSRFNHDMLCQVKLSLYSGTELLDH